MQRFPSTCRLVLMVGLALFAGVSLGTTRARAQCTETQFQNYTGGGQVACPCFVAGEQAGAVFTLPAAAYPIEILKVGIGWGSQFGGTGYSLEQAIHVYQGGLPNPGSPIFTLEGPQLFDGALNEFNLEPIPGEIMIPSGPFTVTLEFANDNAGNFFAPSVVHDGNGCQGGKNVIYANPGGWLEACSQGVTGDWVFYVKYRSLAATASANPTTVVFSSAPGNQTTCDSFDITNTGCDTLMIAGIAGCDNAPFSVDSTLTSHSVPPGGSTSINVCVTPTTSSPDNCAITVYSNAANGPTVVNVSLDAVTAVGTPSLGGYEIVGVVPNPFNPQTAIRFMLPEAVAVTAEVWAVDGSRVVTLLKNRELPAGQNEVRWDGHNANGEHVASGVYLFRLSSALGARTTRLVLLQ